MASLYNSVSVANLEASSGKDYSALDVRLTDAIIESMGISRAEVFVEGTTGSTPSSSSSNVVKYAIMILADRLIDAYLKGEGVINEKEPYTPSMIGKNIYTEDIVEMLKSKRRSIWIEEE
jgi:hypothetical protein